MKYELYNIFSSLENKPFKSIDATYQHLQYTSNITQSVSKTTNWNCETKKSTTD